jgi:hypothetical protein
MAAIDSLAAGGERECNKHPAPHQFVRSEGGFFFFGSSPSHDMPSGSRVWSVEEGADGHIYTGGAACLYLVF